MYVLQSPNKAQLHLQVKQSGDYMCVYLYVLCILSTRAKIHWKTPHTHYTMPTSLMLTSEFVLSHYLIFKA